MTVFDLHHSYERLRALSDTEYNVSMRSRQARDCGSLSCPSSAVVSDAVDVEGCHVATNTCLMLLLVMRLAVQTQAPVLESWAPSTTDMLGFATKI